MTKRIASGMAVAAVLLLFLAQVAWAAPPTIARIIHIVQWGETLSGIALRYGTTVQAIANLNSIANPSRIYAGQRLVISTGTPSPSPACGFNHVVRSGDTLSDLSRRFGVGTTAIAQANRIVNPNRIYAGQQLWIPCPTPAPRPGSYVVQRGDTLTGIALRHGVSVWSIVVANNIANPNLIFAGQRLVIPS